MEACEEQIQPTSVYEPYFDLNRFNYDYWAEFYIIMLLTFILLILLVHLLNFYTPGPI